MQVNAISPTDAVAVVIPHLDKMAETRACCATLAAQRVPSALIIIVDNGSTAHTEQDLVAACPDAQVVRLATNQGFARAVNIGIRHALQHAAITHILILNNDTSCPPDTIGKLLATSISDPAHGITGCPLREGTGTQTSIVPPGKKLKGPWAIPFAVRPGEDPDYLSGTCLLLKRAMLGDIGLFDENFFFYWEDADFSRRARNAGWKLAVTPDVTIQHWGSSTARCFSTLLAEGYRAGHLRFLQKYTRCPRLRALPPFLFRLFLDTCTGQWGAVRGNIKGFHAGWRACRKASTPPSP